MTWKRLQEQTSAGTEQAPFGRRQVATIAELSEARGSLLVPVLVPMQLQVLMLVQVQTLVQVRVQTLVQAQTLVQVQVQMLRELLVCW